MGLDPNVLVGAGLGVAENVINAVTSQQNSLKQRQFAEHMYGWQRQDALADWAMQNEYNSPKAQMQRYREAGLNPNLIYGQSNTAGAVRSSSADNPSTQPVHVDSRPITSSLLSQYDIKLKQAQTDNVLQATTVAKQDEILRKAQVLSTLAGVDKTETDTETGRFNLSLSKELKQESIDAARLQNEKTATDIGISLAANERAAAMNSKSLLEATERILNLRMERAKTGDERDEIKTRIDNLMKDGQLKQLDIDLKKSGVQPSDNLFMRMLYMLLGLDRDKIKEFGKNLGDTGRMSTMDRWNWKK